MCAHRFWDGSMRFAACSFYRFHHSDKVKVRAPNSARDIKNITESTVYSDPGPLSFEVPEHVMKYLGSSQPRAVAVRFEQLCDISLYPLMTRPCCRLDEGVGLECTSVRSWYP